MVDKQNDFERILNDSNLLNTIMSPINSDRRNKIADQDGEGSPSQARKSSHKFNFNLDFDKIKSTDKRPQQNPQIEVEKGGFKNLKVKS